MKTYHWFVYLILFIGLGAVIGFWYPTDTTDPIMSKIERFKKKKREDAPFEAAAFWSKRSRTPIGISPSQVKWQIKENLEKRKRTESNHLLPLHVDEMGPGNFGGRIRSILLHPQDIDTILIGGVAGGIWKTTNGGKSWKCTDDFLANLSIGCIEQDPNVPNRVFVGTGEGFWNGDAMQGFGIFFSEDFGESWQHLTATQTDDFYYVNRLVRIPGTSILMAATRTGIWRSEDLGQTWAEVSGAITSVRGFVDLKVDPSDPSRIFAVHFANVTGNYVMRSTDYGLTFVELGLRDGLPTVNVGRMELAFGRQGTLYVLAAKSVSIPNPTETSNETRGIWRSIDGGVSFEDTHTLDRIIGWQGWYNQAIAVDPNDDEHVVVGAIKIWDSTDGARHFNVKSEWSPDEGQTLQYVHADIHSIVFHPANSLVYWIGSDGGCFKTMDGGQTFEKLNTSLNLTQYYGIAVHPNGQSVIGGAQDNGTHMFYGSSSSWLYWGVGDGGYCAWDQQEPRYIYGSHYNGFMYGSPDGGRSYVYIDDFNTKDTLFIPPFEIDPNDGNRMLAATGTLYYTENLRELDNLTWHELTDVVGHISAVAFHPLLPERAYFGTVNGQLNRSVNLGANAVFEPIGGLSPDDVVTWILPDGSDVTGNTLYVTLGGYFGDRILRSEDNGSTFVSIQGDLPQMPVHCISVDPADSRRLFLGTEMGLWTAVLPNEGSPISWYRYEYGIPYTRVTQLRWGDENTLWVATHGRSIFRMTRQILSASITGISGDSCDQDGILDVGESGIMTIELSNTTGVTLDDVQLSMSCDLNTLEFGEPMSQTVSLQPEETMLIAIDVSLSDYEENCIGEQAVQVAVTHADQLFIVDQNLFLDGEPFIPETIFFDGAEGDTLFMSDSLFIEEGWVKDSSQAYSGTSSWHAGDHDSWSLKTLTSPWFRVLDEQATLNFQIRYDLEFAESQAWDGAVIEIKTANSDWQDVGHLCSVPYDGKLYSNNPLYYRMAWTGNHNLWRQAELPIGEQFLNKHIQFRFVLGTDTISSLENGGLWVDDIQLSHVSWEGVPTCEINHCPGCRSLFYEAFETEMNARNWPGDSSVSNYIQILNTACAE